MLTVVTPDDVRSLSLLSGLTDHELTHFILHCEYAQCPAETKFVSQGDTEQTLFFLLTGSAQVILNVTHVGEEVIAELPAGSVFGEASFFHAAPHTATVKCVDVSRLLRLRREKYEQLCREESTMALKIGANAAKLLAERMQHMDAWVAEHLQASEDRRIHETWARFRSRSYHTSFSGGFHVT